MKVTIVCPGWPGRVNKFNGVFVRDQARQIKKTGADVSVITARVFKEDPMFAVEDGIPVYRFRFPSQRKLLAEYERVPYFRVAVYLASGIIKTIRVVRREKPDIIHAHFVVPTGLIGVVAGLMTKRPVVITAHDADVSTFPEASRVARFLVRWTIKHSAKLIPTTTQLAALVKTNLEIPEDKIEVIPLGIDTRLFKPMDKAEARRRLDLPPEQPILLFIGALLPVKGVEVVVKTMPEIVKRFPDALYIFVGAGPLEGPLKAEIKDKVLEKAALWAGPLSHEDLPGWYAAADVLVFLAPLGGHGQGMVILEAAAVGLPIVATELGGIPDTVKPGVNGYLANPEDIVEAVEYISQALKPGAFPEIGKAAETIRDTLGEEAIAVRLVEFYSRITG
jgi:glycosyltransferase involved in cell wall biosynthesis